MGDWADVVVPIVAAFVALAGGVYATRGKLASDRGDLADRLIDQAQEERDRADRIIAEQRAELDLRRRLHHQDADYIVRLRRQIEACGETPEPYPGLDS